MSMGIHGVLDNRARIFALCCEVFFLVKVMVLVITKLDIGDEVTPAAVNHSC